MKTLLALLLTCFSAFASAPSTVSIDTNGAPCNLGNTNAWKTKLGFLLQPTNTPATNATIVWDFSSGRPVWAFLATGTNGSNATISAAYPLSANTNVDGSVTISITDRLPYVHVNNVRDFGAVNDGATDSTTAFNNAFTASASNGYPVYVPQGAFVCDAITLPAGVKAVFGDGYASRVVFKTGSTGWMWDAGSITCSFWGLRLSGGATNSFNGAGYTAGTRSGLKYSTTDHSLAHELYIDGFNAVGLTVTGDSNIYTRIDYASLDNINAWNNYCAIEFSTQKTEYIKANNFTLYNCYYGIYCLSANIEFSGHRITDNYIGAYFSAGDSRIHQNFVNSSINHCTYALKVVNGSTGLNVANVRVMGSGIISLENADGVHIHGGLFEGVTLNVDVASGQNVFNNNVFAGSAANYINDASGRLIAFGNYDSYSNTLAQPSGKGGYGVGPGDTYYFRGIPYRFPTNSVAGQTVWLSNSGMLSNAVAAVYPTAGRRFNINDENDFTYISQMSLANPVAHTAGLGVYRVPAKFGTGGDSFLYDATAAEFLNWLGATTNAVANGLAQRTSDGVLAAQAFDGQYSMTTTNAVTNVIVKVAGSTIYRDATAAQMRTFIGPVDEAKHATNADSSAYATSAANVQGYYLSTNSTPSTIALRDVDGVGHFAAVDLTYDMSNATGAVSSIPAKMAGSTILRDANANQVKTWLGKVSSATNADNATYASTAATANNLGGYGYNTNSTPSTLALRDPNGVGYFAAMGLTYGMTYSVGTIATMLVKLSGDPILKDANANQVRDFLGWMWYAGRATNATWANYATNAGSADYATAAGTATSATTASSATYATSAGSATTATTAANSSALGGFGYSAAPNPSTIALRTTDAVLSASAFNATYDMSYSSGTITRIPVKLSGDTLYHDATPAQLKVSLGITTNDVGGFSGYTDSVGAALNGKEPALGNPSVSGYVPSKSTSGVVTWVPNGSGGGISGGGSGGWIPIFNSSSSVTNSLIYQSSGAIYFQGDVWGSGHKINVDKTANSEWVSTPTLYLQCTNGQYYPLSVVIIGGTATLRIGTPGTPP